MLYTFIQTIIILIIIIIILVYAKIHMVGVLAATNMFCIFFTFCNNKNIVHFHLSVLRARSTCVMYIECELYSHGGKIHCGYSAPLCTTVYTTHLCVKKKIITRNLCGQLKRKVRVSVHSNDLGRPRCSVSSRVFKSFFFQKKDPRKL